MMRFGASIVGVAAASTFGGHKMERQFAFYHDLPVGEHALRHAGWHKHAEHGCDPHLGFGWTVKAEGATKKEPLIIYTTAGGQSAGLGTIIIGKGRAQFDLEQQQWASSTHLVAPKNDPDIAHIDVAFRSGGIVCSGATATGVDEIGDVVIVNPAGHSKTIPSTEEQADKEGYHRGSCFDGMGWHRILDTSRQDGTMSWHGQNVFPITPMYFEGKLVTLFFQSRLDQVTVPFVASNGWDPKPLSDKMMCQNTCDGDECTFGDVPDGAWNTMHIYLQDHKKVVCPHDLHCAISFPFRASCCPTSVQV